MPKINIIEKDYTTGGFAEIENIVYIPGLFGATTIARDAVAKETPTLCTSVKDLTTYFGDQAQDKSYIMAYELLNLGMYVLYEGFDSEADLREATFDKLKDKGLYNIRFLTLGGYAGKLEEVTKETGEKDENGDPITVTNTKSVFDNTLIGKMTTCAEARGDCIALIDHPEDYSISLETFDTQNPYDLFKSKFAAAFTPWCYFNTTTPVSMKTKPGTKEKTSDLINANGYVSLPGSYCYLAAFAQSVRTNPTWYAVAGSIRGQIPNMVKPCRLYGELDAEILNHRNEGKVAVNPICNINPYGYIIWGNRTLHPVGAATVPQSDLVASNFLNIRNLVTDIRKTVWTACRRLTFEQNNDILWINFKAQITPLLDRMSTGNGISGYKMIKQAPDRKAQLKAKIRIIPVEAVEDFDITLELTDSLEIITE